MAINWSDVSNLDSTLAAVPAATQGSILFFVRKYLNETSWGEFYDQATLLLAAHMGSVALRGGGSGGVGAVQSESAGSVSRSYGSAPSIGAGNSWDTTVWGQQYKTLARAVFGGGMVI